MNSFVQFDDLLIERVFNPLSEWFFTQFNISNYKIARYLCLLIIICALYDIYAQIALLKLGNAAIDLAVPPTMILIQYWAKKEDEYSPGTMSAFRANYLLRFIVFTGNILICLFMSSSVITTPIMSNLMVLVYYFMACDKPKGDRLRAFKTSALHGSDTA
jgi:succinate-acetate transporter protein